MLSRPVEKTSTTQETILITAATVTAELSEVNHVAKRMTLGVMNAKTITHRAGESAKGFQPITDFIEQIARDVTRFVAQISREASILSRLAVEYNRRGAILKQYQRVMKQAEGASHVASVAPVIKQLSDAAQSDRALFIKNLRTLTELLDEMKTSIRTSKVISTTSRVEAACAKEFRKNLEVVADDLESATEEIRKHVMSSHDKLTTVTHLLQREARP